MATLYLHFMQTLIVKFREINIFYPKKHSQNSQPIIKFPDLLRVYRFI